MIASVLEFQKSVADALFTNLNFVIQDQDLNL